MWHVKVATTKAYEPSAGKPKETDRLEDLDTDEQIILKQIGSTVVKVLCYNSEGRWFDSSWCQWIFH